MKPDLTVQKTSTTHTTVESILFFQRIILAFNGDLVFWD